MKLNPFTSYNFFQHFLPTALALSKNILIVGSGNSALDLCSGIQKARNALNRGCPGVSGDPRGTGVSIALTASHIGLHSDDYTVPCACKC